LRDGGQSKNPTEPPNGQASLFADPRVEAAVRQILQQPTGALSQDSLLSLTQLYAKGLGIADLGGIDQLRSLQRLDLANNQIQDLSPLSTLKQLTYLDLSRSQVQVLSALSGLQQLQTLVLDHNLVPDLSPLAGRSQLRRVGLMGDPLNEDARNTQVPALQSRGVQVDMGTSEKQPGVILFTSNRAAAKYSDLYAMNPDGSDVVRLTQQIPGTIRAVQEAVWSPDGTKIAFVTDRDDNREIYVMNADGSNPVNLTNNPASEFLWAWQ
jgi:hypothetical protein